MTIHWLVGGFALSTLLLTGCAAQQKCGSADCVADTELTAAVTARLNQYPELSAPNQVYVKTRDGVVYLTGQVATDLQRRTAESVARQTPGVRKVNDNIALSYGGR